VYPELVRVLKETPMEGTELGDLKDFLKPDFKVDREDFEPGKNPELLKDVDVLAKQLPPNLIESGRFHMYPSGHGMGWHTNKDNVISDDGQRNYRMYTVHTTGESYFLYRHTVSKKVHAVRDVDGTSLIFSLLIDSEPFWHAVLCKTGTRLSYGIKFGKDTLESSIPNIWDSKETGHELTFKYAKNNKNLTNYYIFEKGFSPEMCNDIRTRLQDVPLIDGVVGTGQVNIGIRSSRVYWLPKNQKFIDVYSTLFRMVGRANDVFFNFQIESIDAKIQYTVYDEASKGHYGWHMDIGSINSRRKLSVVVQLSDPSEYEGGELQIQSDNTMPITLEKEKGTVLIFPSYLLHRVTPVTKGTRRSLVLWVEGPPFN
jgi:PKHD-type hydroxylase